ncbi:MAG: DUF4177 domain-containing protein [Candidatus Aenigmarchaeota archaeon]|nr:DUF4177 domain-containing protein [Candidatus Aenigmarchaeota archaeon]
MYEYETVRVEIVGLINTKLKEDYREIIKQRGKDGWRLIQLFAPPIAGAGDAPFIDIIFEKKF